MAREGPARAAQTALEAEARRLSEELAGYRRELKRRRDGEAWEARRRRRMEHGGVRGQEALLVYVLTNYDADAAAAFLQRRGGSKVTEGGLFRGPSRQGIEEEFLRAPLDSIIARLTPRDEREEKSLQRARAFANDWHLERWVQSVNERSGVAPSTRRVLERYDELLAEGQPQDDLEGDPRQAIGESRHRMWAWRWRRRMAVKLKRVRHREHMPLEAMRRKAGGPARTKSSTGGRKVGHKNGPTFGPAPRTHFAAPEKKTARKRCPPGGPRNRTPKITTALARGAAR